MVRGVATGNIGAGYGPYSVSLNYKSGVKQPLIFSVVSSRTS